jgi:hypothetical protein
MNQAPTQEESKSCREIKYLHKINKTYEKQSGGLDESSPYRRRIKIPQNNHPSTKKINP